MPDSRQADPQVLLASLGIGSVSSITPVTGGQDTLIWRVERGAKAYALRLFRGDQHEAAQREALAISTADARLPVPKIVAQGIWSNRPVMLLEWCEGVPLLHCINPFASPNTELRRLRRALERAWRQGYREVAGELTDLPLFYAIAGLAMLHDLAPRVANPDHWLQPHHMEPVRRWARYWRHYAGVR